MGSGKKEIIPEAEEYIQLAKESKKIGRKAYGLSQLEVSNMQRRLDRSAENLDAMDAIEKAEHLIEVFGGFRDRMVEILNKLTDYESAIIEKMATRMMRDPYADSE